MDANEGDRNVCPQMDAVYENMLDTMQQIPGLVPDEPENEIDVARVRIVGETLRLLSNRFNRDIRPQNVIVFFSLIKFFFH